MPSLNTGWFRGKTLSVKLTLCKDELYNCYINKFVGETKFKFGDGETVGSLKSVIIPAQIGNSEIMIQTDVISSELPLLLSKDAMKKANTKIDFTNDRTRNWY